MPREQINYPNVAAVMIYKGNELEYEPGSDIPEGAEVFADPALHVSWQVAGQDLGSHVQVSLEMPAGFLKARAENLDALVINTWVYTPSLDRKDINKLIRVLRTARDKAYGRDE